MMKLNKKSAVALELAAIASVQCGASIAKNLFHTMGAAGATLLRVGIAGAVLTLVVRPKFWKFTRAQWGAILFYGLSTGAMNLAFYYGIQRVPLGIGVGVEFTGPLCLALLSSRKLTDFVWAVLSGAGIALIVPWHAGEGMLDPLGLMLVAIAGVMWALYIVSGTRLSGKIPASDAVSCGMWVATLFVLPFALISGDVFAVNGKLLAMGFGVAMLSSAIPFTLELLVMKKLPPKTFSILSSLDPAFAALSGLIFLGEWLTVSQTVAIILIMAASAGAALTAPEKK